MIGARTTIETRGGFVIMHLGTEDIAEQLAKAVDAAEEVQRQD